MPVSRQQRDSNLVNRRLGRGINMGNMFEAPSEEAWGNPWKSGYFQQIAELGFRHVRIPVRWEPANRSQAQPPYTIDSLFLQRIQQVVDEALANQLMVILNMHHHEALNADPDGQRERFLAQWLQIAEKFASYPNSLVFELLNEPHNNLSSEKWNVLLTEGLSQVRKISPTRTVLIGPAEWGGLSGLSKLALPSDGNIILTLHYYEPFQFTHQGAEWLGQASQAWIGTSWLDLDIEREAIRQQFQPVLHVKATHGIPVHIGEFGAYSRADMHSRVRWTRFLARYFDEQEFSWSYWEFSSSFGIYDPQSRELRKPLVNALLHDPLPDASRTQKKMLMHSNFSSGNDSWILMAHGQAKASEMVGGGSVQVNIENGGQEPWHVQWIRVGLALTKGKSYRITFRASAAAARTLHAYFGKNDHPWSPYNDYPEFTVTNVPSEQFFDVFMKDATDPNARIVFDLGRSSSQVVFHEIRLEELMAG
jgi:aryl-phospho-beta-D-glucosidase BglC (GH1 family)